MQIAFFFLAGSGIVAAVVGILLNTARALQHRDSDIFTRSLPWGYMGVGLAVATCGFFLCRSVSERAAPQVTDPWGLFLVFVVASAGYGAARQMTESSRMGNIWPIGLSLALGVAAGLSSVAV